MKVVSYNRYLTEYQAKWPKDMVFFNPDNSATLFEEGDLDLRDWVYKNGKKLKAGNYKVDLENAVKIRELIKGEEGQSKQSASSSEPQSRPLSAKQVKEILLPLEEAQKVNIKVLQGIITELVKALS